MVIKKCQAGLLVSALLFLSACVAPGQKIISEADEKWLSSPDVFEQGYKDHADLSQWRYSAKVGVITPEESSQANMIWVFDDNETLEAKNIVRLFGPLGIGSIKIEFDEHSVQLSDKSGLLHQGASAEELLHRIVGWPIPVDALRYWLFSLPQPGIAYRYLLEDQAPRQLKALRQFDWQINYSDYRDFQKNGRLLARKIVAKKQASSEQEITVTLITKTWK